VEHSHFFEQDHGYTTALALADFGAQFYKQRFNIAPLDVSAGRASEDQFKSSLVLALHANIVPRSSTEIDEHTPQTANVESSLDTLFQRHSPTTIDPKNPKVLNTVDCAGIHTQ